MAVTEEQMDRLKELGARMKRALDDHARLIGMVGHIVLDGAELINEIGDPSVKASLEEAITSLANHVMGKPEEQAR